MKNCDLFRDLCCSCNILISPATHLSLLHLEHDDQSENRNGQHHASPAAIRVSCSRHSSWLPLISKPVSSARSSTPGTPGGQDSIASVRRSVAGHRGPLKKVCKCTESPFSADTVRLGSRR